jgi:hypothetical protein
MSTPPLARRGRRRDETARAIKGHFATLGCASMLTPELKSINTSPPMPASPASAPLPPRSNPRKILIGFAGFPIPSRRSDPVPGLAPGNAL